MSVLKHREGIFHRGCNTMDSSISFLARSKMVLYLRNYIKSAYSCCGDSGLDVDSHYNGADVNKRDSF